MMPGGGGELSESPLGERWNASSCFGKGATGALWCPIRGINSMHQIDSMPPRNTAAHRRDSCKCSGQYDAEGVRFSASDPLRVTVRPNRIGSLQSSDSLSPTSGGRHRFRHAIPSPSGIVRTGVQDDRPQSEDDVFTSSFDLSDCATGAQRRRPIMRHIVAYLPAWTPLTQTDQLLNCYSEGHPMAALYQHE